MADDIIQLDKIRNQKAEERKRKTERIFFTQLIGAYGVMSNDRLLRIDLVDVSEVGLGFQLPHKEEKIWPNQMDNQKLRFYFSPESYLELSVDIKNSRPVIDGGVRMVRYGAEIHTEQRSYQAWTQFVSFLRSYSDVFERDDGNVGVSGF